MARRKRVPKRRKTRRRTRRRQRGGFLSSLNLSGKDFAYPVHVAADRAKALAPFLISNAGSEVEKRIKNIAPFLLNSIGDQIERRGKNLVNHGISSVKKTVPNPAKIVKAKINRILSKIKQKF